MPKRRKRARRTPEAVEAYIFEVGEVRPSYLLSVNSHKYRNTAFSEHMDIGIEAKCVFPTKLDGRGITMTLAARREALTPEAFKEDEEWVPNCIGALEFTPGGGRFYTEVPHESFGPIMTSLGQGLLRFVVLYGPPLKRGRSLCSSMQLEYAVNLDDY